MTVCPPILLHLPFSNSASSTYVQHQRRDWWVRMDVYIQMLAIIIIIIIIIIHSLPPVSIFIAVWPLRHPRPCRPNPCAQVAALASVVRDPDGGVTTYPWDRGLRRPKGSGVVVCRTRPRGAGLLRSCAFSRPRLPEDASSWHGGFGTRFSPAIMRIGNC